MYLYLFLEYYFISLTKFSDLLIFYIDGSNFVFTPIFKIGNIIVYDWFNGVTNDYWKKNKDTNNLLSQVFVAASKH
jgi:hypothetical protein